MTTERDATARPAGAPLGPGAVLAGKYRIEGLLGSGGMAAVFEATHLQLGEPVAIKVLHRHVLGRHGALERFLREARVAMRLRSEHVARVFDVGTAADDTPFIVMELLRGSDLASLLGERGPLPVATAVDYLLQACQALVEAHVLGVVHRDLKPANLFLCTTFDGLPCVKVLDFGVSKLQGAFHGAGVLGVTTASGPDSERAPLATRTTISGPVRGVSGGVGEGFPGSVTLTQAFLGSPQYMAPEQIVSARDVDARADVWALGVIFFELVSGEHPFEASTLDLLCESILERHPRPLDVPGGAPPGLELAIATCLAKDPADRYQSVRAFAEGVVQLGSGDAKLSLDRIVRMVEGKAAGQARPRIVASGPATLLSGEDSVLAVATHPPPSKVSRRKARPWIGLALVAAAALSIAGLALSRATFSRPQMAGPPNESVALLPPPTLPLAVTAPPAIPAPNPSVAGASDRPKAVPVASAGHPRAISAGPRPSVSASPAASASARGTADPALGLDTGELFMERR